jgi:hypothetical protein
MSFACRGGLEITGIKSWLSGLSRARPLKAMRMWTLLSLLAGRVEVARNEREACEFFTDAALQRTAESQYWYGSACETRLAPRRIRSQLSTS